MMVSVLLRLKASSDMLKEYPNLSAYVARGEARPAYKRAFDAQLEVFNAASARQENQLTEIGMLKTTLTLSALYLAAFGLALTFFTLASGAGSLTPDYSPKH